MTTTEIRDDALALLPTLPGLAAGIVGLAPLTLQCHDCGIVSVRAERTMALGIILSGFHFHICEGRTGVRRCPACLVAVKASCDRDQCSRDARQAREAMAS